MKIKKNFENRYNKICFNFIYHFKTIENLKNSNLYKIYKKHINLTFLKIIEYIYSLRICFVQMEKNNVEKLDMEAYQKKWCKWSLFKNKNIRDPHIHSQV